MFRKKISLLILFVVVLNATLLLFKPTVNAQIQDTDFSGNRIESYQCFDQRGNVSDVPPDAQKDVSGYWLCNCEDGNPPDSRTFKCAEDLTNPGCHPPNEPDEYGRPGDPGCFAARSVLKPPKLQQLEIWFAKIIYIVWALVGALSFFYLIFLGYKYMLTRGDITKITEIRQKIIYYIIGFVIVFLAVPVLSTIFRLLGINRDVDCYNVDMPGFQFFFADLCTDPNNAIANQVLSDPCSVDPDDVIGKICGRNVVAPRCPVPGNLELCTWYECSETTSGTPGLGVWIRSGEYECSIDPRD